MSKTASVPAAGQRDRARIQGPDPQPRASRADRSADLLEIPSILGNRATAALVQAKLRVGPPNDRYEQEADRVADIVMRSAAPKPPSGTGHDHGLIQRCGCQGTSSKCALEREQADTTVQRLAISKAPSDVAQREAVNLSAGVNTEFDDEEPDQKTPEDLVLEHAERGLVQRQAAGETPGSVMNLDSRLHRLRSGGEPLPAPERAYFDQRFGRDFSTVRLHTDSAAAQLSEELGARAFTHREHVFFGAGEYRRDAEGRRLLAHELTHTIQQGAARSHTSASPSLIQRKPLKKRYRARIIELRDAAGNARPVTTCQDVNATGCRTDVLRAGMEVTVTSEWVGGLWSFVENLPEPAVKALHGQKWIYVTTAMLERVPETARKPAPGTGTVEATSEFLGPGWREVNELGIVYQPTGANVRDKPLPPEEGSVVLVNLAQNTKVFILRHEPKAKWYAVAAINPRGGGGTFGYVAEWLLWRKLPEPDAAVIKIKSGEYPLQIAKDYYRGQGFNKWGHDPRYLVNALVYINQKADHNGVGPPGITKPKGDVTADWAEASARAETYIWVPSAAFMRAIYEEVAERGGGTGSISADLWRTASKLVHGFFYGVAFIGGLIHGFVKSVYDAIEALAKLVIDLLVSIFTREVIKDAKEIWDSISKLTWKDIKAAFGEWVDAWFVKLNSSSPWVSGHAHGYLTGYIMAEAAQLLISAGTLAAVKSALWASRLGKLIQASKAYRALAKGISTAVRVGGKTGEALKVASTSLRTTRVFHGLHVARDWAKRAFNISTEFAKDLSLGAINLLATLGDDALEQLRKLSQLAKRVLFGCQSPCSVDLPRIKAALENLKKLKVPRTAIEFIRPGLTKGLNKINPTILRLARMKRALVGVSMDAFKKYNVAVGRFVIEGGEELFVTVVNKSGGMHAEEELLSHLQQLRTKYKNANKKVTLDQVFTERIPCSGTGKNPANCRLKLWTESKETKTFYAVAGSSATDLETTKAKWLMEVVYGITD